jgi:predicted transcriptional regulator
MLGWSFSDAIFKFLLEQQRPCTVDEIADCIKARGVKSNSQSSVSSTRSGLYALKKQNKVTQISRNAWELKKEDKEITEDSNEHEQL